MLRIAEQWHQSDRGRQRQGNEDSYFVRSPLFVVADGMGGAQAGEVASRMAVESFDGGLPDGTPAEGLTHVVEEANRRIHERSQADAQRAGMGTTVTAAYVGEGEVTIAHVGDSRAYVLRDGDLSRLTRDHSLVGELVERGKLTEEQAETHPQRSVITRALGPEPDVQVDIRGYQARGGDVFLLCSDGLTSMIPEARVKQILEESDTLADAGRELIAAANDAGGRDNITVLLFRLEEVAASTGVDAGETSKVEAVGEHQGAATMTLPAVSEAEAPRKRPAEPIAEEPPAAPRRKRRRRRIPGALIALIIAVAIVGAALWTASRAVYFVGVDDESQVVTIYRGLPYELPFGIELYGSYYPSGVSLAQVPTARRGTFTDHKLRSKDDAEDLVRQLERGQIE
ncbi:MAG TPA: Stp1/IreP family PP2C-type Ser/Thr phosphatase [Solirubrobacteraceae bacterium]|nr:Stp1/IreP family PP2C-type Ser/Thr phosphatase [Solirubrobacteraceae bacterium]